MNKLLNKTLKSFAIYSFIVFVFSVPSYFLLIDWIWLTELDENNELIAQRIENEFNDQHITDEKLDESIKFWNEIQSVGKIEPVQFVTFPKDSVYTIRRQNPYSESKSIDRFRGLITHIEINNQIFSLTVETNVEEEEEIIAYIALVALLFFLILIVGFYILNRRLSDQLWQPFRSTLAKLKTFKLNSQTPIEFEKTSTLEFQELNQALQNLIEHNISIFKMQKEFTENASHELQTPLAIIKNKLDILLQKESVTDRQYQIIEDINKALTRVSRINKNLLLLAKIENHQFNESETINLSELIKQCLQQFNEHFENKNIRIQTEIENEFLVTGNKILIDILINNLVLNAVRHNSPNGIVKISLNNTGLFISNSGIQALETKNLFKRFKKQSAQSSGSGLGLAIVEQICKRHQWSIAYEFQKEMHIFKILF